MRQRARLHFNCVSRKPRCDVLNQDLDSACLPHRLSLASARRFSRDAFIQVAFGIIKTLDWVLNYGTRLHLSVRKV